MAGRFTSPITAEYDSSGNPLAGAKLSFFESGTSTPLDTYSDDDLSVANQNPVVANSAGRWGPIFLKEQDYKVILKTSADVTIWTADPVRAAEPISTATRAVSTTDTQVASDNGKLILADATAGAFTYTLLPAATAGDGFTVYVKKVDSSSNAVTVDADGSEAIDGDSDVTLPNQWDSVGLRSNGTAWRIIVPPLTADSIPLPKGYINGLEASINATDAEHDIDLAAGVARDEDDEANMVLASAITKRIDAAWAVGDGNGGLDTGSVANTTVYYIWLIRRSDTGVVDALFSTSSTAPTMPSSYDQKRLLGQLSTDGSANIAQLYVRQDEAPGVATVIATTSGTAHDFLGIPSWVTRITVELAGVSTSGTSIPLLQIGDSGGVETTGYTGTAVSIDGATASTSTLSAGFILDEQNHSATVLLHGAIEMTIQSAAAFRWVGRGVIAGSSGNSIVTHVAGYKETSAALDRVRLTTTNGTDTFDAGSVNIRYS